MLEVKGTVHFQYFFVDTSLYALSNEKNKNLSEQSNNVTKHTQNKSIFDV